MGKFDNIPTTTIEQQKTNNKPDNIKETPETTEQESTTEKITPIDHQKTIRNEQILLSNFKGKAGKIANILILTSSLLLGSKGIPETSAETTKTEQQDKKENSSDTIYKIIQETGEKNENDAELLKDINLVYIYVMHNGIEEKILLSAEDLSSGSNIKIDGYITGIFAFTKNKTEVALNGDKLNNVQTSTNYANENIKNIEIEGSVLEPQDLATENYDNEFFTELTSNHPTEIRIEHGEPIEYLSGGYYKGEEAPGNNHLGEQLTNQENNELSLSRDGKQFKIKIEQKTLVKLSSVDGINYNYLGNEKEDFEETEKLKEKLKAISLGIHSVEKIIGEKIIDTVNIFDIDKENASASQTEKKITFLSEYIKTSSPEIIQNITEHEVLHKLVDITKYIDNPKLRILFADLKGYSGDKKKSITRKGYVVFDDFNKDYDNKNLFKFIAEKNFFNRSTGGHPHSNVFEFYTSFIHSLMYCEKLESNLEKLEDENEKKEILELYKTTTEEILQQVENIPIVGIIYDNKEEEFLKKALQQIIQTQQKYGF